jgi:hypothetical protein
MTFHGIGQQQKNLPYRRGSVVQNFSHPDQLFIIHGCSTALQFCDVAKQRETYIVCVVTETDIVCIVTEGTGKFHPRTGHESPEGK